MEYLQVGVGAPLKPVLNLANIVASIRHIYMFWEHSPSSTNIASDWLRAELSCGWGRNKNKNGWRCRYVLRPLRRDFFYLLTCGRRSLVSGIPSEIVVNWITLWGMIKFIKYTDLTLACILDHAVCCASAASSGRSLHLIASQLRTKYCSSNGPNHVRWTKSSIKEWIIVLFLFCF